MVRAQKDMVMRPIAADRRCRGVGMVVIVILMVWMVVHGMPYFK